MAELTLLPRGEKEKRMGIWGKGIPRSSTAFSPNGLFSFRSSTFRERFEKSYLPFFPSSNVSVHVFFGKEIFMEN
jgi:hypothetical protein